MATVNQTILQTMATCHSFLDLYFIASQSSMMSPTTSRPVIRLLLYDPEGHHQTVSRPSSEYSSTFSTLTALYLMHTLSYFYRTFVARCMELASSSKIDLMRTYNQISVKPADIPKITVTTPFRTFQFLLMPFNLHNAVQTFRNFIDAVIRGLPFVYACIDDVLVNRSSDEEHNQHMRLQFQRCLNKARKCSFRATSLHFHRPHLSANCRNFLVW